MIAIEEIRRAREVLEGTALRTPLVRFDVDSDADRHVAEQREHQRHGE